MDNFELAFTSAPIGIALVGTDGRWLRVNKAVCDMFGYEEDELLRTDFQSLTHADDLENDLSLVSQVLAGEIPNYRMVKRYYHKQGHIVWAQLDVSLARDADGQPKWFIAHVQDISKQRMSDKLLREGEERLALALDVAGLGIWDWNVATSEVHYDEGWAMMLGYRQEELKSSFSTWQRLVHPDDLEGAEQIVADYLSGRAKQYNSIFRMIAKDGSWRWIHSAGRVIERDESGAPLRLVGVHFDITAEKNYQDALLTAKEAAEQANRLKSNFLANMSHEIRTPMNGIIGMTQLALCMETEDGQRELLETIEYSANHLLGIINDILDLSKIESGRFELCPRSFEIEPMLSRAFELLKVQVREKNLHYQFQFDENIPKVLICDAERLRQVVLNLLGNAVKFTPNGGAVEFKVELCSIGAESCRVRFRVEDTGIGIAKEKQPQLFEPFVQGNSFISKDYGGTGLGLSISRKLVNLLGGEIDLESEPGKGSVFSFELEMRIGGEQAAKDSSPDPSGVERGAAKTKRLRVLVAEDNKVNQTVVIRMLESAGHTVVLVENGLEAVERCQAEQFDVVLMDVQMPVLSGSQATERIRRSGSKIPIIAVTAHALSEERVDIMASGFDAYISKPLHKDDLLGLVEATVQKSQDSGPHSKS